MRDKRTPTDAWEATSLLVVHPGRNSTLKHVPAKVYLNTAELPKKSTFGNK